MERVRRLRGGVTLDDQIADLTDRYYYESREAVERVAWIVMTLETPMPLDIFHAQLADGLGSLLGTGTRYTITAELDSGYPLVVSGPIGADLMTNLEAFHANMVRVHRGNLSDSAALPSPGANSSAEEQLVVELESASTDLRRRVVVLGFTVPFADYEALASDLAAYPVAALEVELDPNAAPFRAHDEILDLHEVGELRAEYE